MNEKKFNISTEDLNNYLDHKNWDSVLTVESVLKAVEYAYRTQGCLHEVFKQLSDIGNKSSPDYGHFQPKPFRQYKKKRCK